MKTVTLDILKDEAYNLLKDLETLKIIRIKDKTPDTATSMNLATKYSGAMSKQSKDEIDNQWNELRNEWD